MNPKVLIPMIRKVMPTIMAQQIVGVQPMHDAGLIFAGGAAADPFNKKYWPHQAYIEHWGKSRDAERWCYDNFKSRYWTSSGRHFAFKRSRDATLFALKWL
jgi:hypothetical protein